MIVELSRRFQIDAAHRNTSVGADDIRYRVHGHTYEATLTARGSVDEQMGWLMDFGELKSMGREAIDQLDHRCLNDIEGLHDTTLDDLRHWLIRSVQSAGNPVTLDWNVRIIHRREERLSDEARDNLQDVTSFEFSAAHFLPRLPDHHKCRRLHGHSFFVHVQTSDTPRVKSAMRQILPDIDHRLLNDIAGLENPTSEVLARWLWQKLQPHTEQLKEIHVSETCTTACRYRGD